MILSFFLFVFITFTQVKTCSRYQTKDSALLAIPKLRPVFLFSTGNNIFSGHRFGKYSFRPVAGLFS
ncbi:MAG TPA: hypothetical protein DIV86_03880 [Alphaproteobacteria bacterium]|nr:hypothetical protein [Alphaproteobacteria bacterium]